MAYIERTGNINGNSLRGDPRYNKRFNKVIMEKVSKELNEIIELLKKAKTEKDIYKILDDACKKQILKEKSNTLFKIAGFYIDTLLQTYGDPYVEKLKKINELENINCAPKLVDYVRVGKSEGVVITYLPGSEENNLIPFNKAKDEVSLEAKENFLKAIEILLNNGFIHTGLLQGKNLYFSPFSKSLLLTNWEALKEINPSQKQELSSEVKKILGF